MGLFFTLHFVGFNWVVAYVLPNIAPVDGLRGGVWSVRFWSLLFTHYWPMLLMTVVTEREMVRGAMRRFDQVGPYFPVMRTWVIFLPLAMLSVLGDVTKLFTIDHIGCYTLAALAYFSPWRLAPRPTAPEGL
ncbi:MAG: hypothetical protein EXS32_12960 [Opitutus sp.]|nr:hypothetical protein [Opitutus sp.]